MEGDRVQDQILGPFSSLFRNKIHWQEILQLAEISKTTWAIANKFCLCKKNKFLSDSESASQIGQQYQVSQSAIVSDQFISKSDKSARSGQSESLQEKLWNPSFSNPLLLPPRLLSLSVYYRHKFDFDKLVISVEQKVMFCQSEKVVWVNTKNNWKSTRATTVSTKQILSRKAETEEGCCRYTQRR